MQKDIYGNALNARQRAALHALRIALDEPEAARVRAAHEAAKARNNRLRSHNLRRSLIARDVIRVAV